MCGSQKWKLPTRLCDVVADRGETGGEGIENTGNEVRQRSGLLSDT